jgi:UDP-N-acetylglucosamine--dolichyl-phosphate N-acetylglucosaminephosphotransferase
MEILLLIPIILSFFITFLVIPPWIKRAKKAGLEGKDMNKYEKTKVAEAGGVAVIAGFIISVLSYIAIKTFYLNSLENLIEIFSLISSIMIISFIGVIDDILGWKIGLGKRMRMFLVLIAAIPLMVINAGESSINLPLINGVNLGLIYPLAIIPLGIIATSTTFNFLAGYNGLEAGQGIIIMTALSIVAYLTGNGWLALIGICLISSLTAFLIFNRFPSSIFPGDTMTYSVGALIAIFAILGNFERIAIFFFIPYIIEVILKSRGKLKKESFAKPDKNNNLNMPYKKIYGLEHFSIWFLKKVKKSKKVKEKEVVYFLWGLQLAVILVGFLLFRNILF